MEEQTNLFLKILKIGAELQGKTISFNEIIEIIKKDFQVPEKMIPAIRRWFYDYFYLSETFRMNKGMINTLPDYSLKQYDEKKAYFTGDGFFKFYEYLEVKKAYENAQISMDNAKQSAEQSNVALRWVKYTLFTTIALGLIQVIFLFIQM